MRTEHTGQVPAGVAEGLQKFVDGHMKFIEGMEQLLGQLVKHGNIQEPRRDERAIGGGAVAKRTRELPATDLGEGLAAGSVCYDWPNTLVLEGGRRVAVPERFASVLRHLLAPLSKAQGRRSFASYDEVGSLYWAARIRTQLPSLTEVELATRRELFKGDLKNEAIKFNRDFQRWAKLRGIDGGALIECDRASHGYQLAKGWSRVKPLISHSEVGRVGTFDDKKAYASIYGGQS